MKVDFEFPKMIILSTTAKETESGPAKPYHRCMDDCCFMD